MFMFIKNLFSSKSIEQPKARYQEPVVDTKSDVDKITVSYSYETDTSVDFKSSSKPAEKVESLDLTVVTKRFKERYAITDDNALSAIEADYRRFLILVLENPEDGIVPWSQVIDDYWHEHILNTKKYYEDCMVLKGGLIHHNPDVPKGTPKHSDLFGRTKQLYYNRFVSNQTYVESEIDDLMFLFLTLDHYYPVPADFLQQPVVVELDPVVPETVEESVVPEVSSPEPEVEAPAAEVSSDEAFSLVSDSFKNMVPDTPSVSHDTSSYSSSNHSTSCSSSSESHSSSCSSSSCSSSSCSSASCGSSCSS